MRENRGKKSVSLNQPVEIRFILYQVMKKIVTENAAARIRWRVCLCKQRNGVTTQLPINPHYFHREKCMLIFYEARRADIFIARGEAPGNDTRCPLPALPAMNSDAGRVACLREAATAKAGVGYPYFCPGLHPGL